MLHFSIVIAVSYHYLLQSQKHSSLEITAVGLLVSQILAVLWKEEMMQQSGEQDSVACAQFKLGISVS